MAVTLPAALRTYMHSEASRDHRTACAMLRATPRWKMKTGATAELIAIGNGSGRRMPRYQYTVTPLGLAQHEGDFRMLANLAGTFPAARRSSCTWRARRRKNRVAENPAAHRTGGPPRAGDRRNQGDRSRSRQSACNVPARKSSRSRVRSRRIFQPIFSRQPTSRAEAGAVQTADAVRDRLGGIDIIVHVAGGSDAPAGGFSRVAGRPLAAGAGAEPARGGEDRPRTRAGAGGTGIRAVVIHVTSIQRQLPLPESSIAYAAAKAALSNYSKGCRRRSARKGVRVLRVSPGWVETDAAVGIRPRGSRARTD